MVTETTWGVTYAPHHPSACRAQRARETLREELAQLAAVEHKLSARAGVPPECRSEYWLGRLSGIASYLLWTLDAEEEAKNG